MRKIEKRKVADKVYDSFHKKNVHTQYMGIIFAKALNNDRLTVKKELCLGKVKVYFCKTRIRMSCAQKMKDVSCITHSLTEANEVFI